MPIIAILYRKYSGLTDAEIERGFLSLRDDGARLEEFRSLTLRLPDTLQEKQTLVEMAERTIEVCRFRAVLAHGVLSGDRLHDDPEIVPNVFHANAKFKKITLSEANMRRYMKQLVQMSVIAKGLLPRGVKVDLGAHSIVIEELGGKSSEEIFDELDIPSNLEDKANKRVAVKFVYSVSRTVSGGSIIQFHRQERIQQISGQPDEFGWPTIRQLHIAERDFLEQWQYFEPNGYLIQYEAVPADGSRGRFSEYRANLGA